MKKLWPITTGLTVLLLLCGACHQAKTPEAASQTVREGKVEQYRSDEGARYSAALVPASQVDLVFKSPGIVQSICQVRGADGRIRDIQAGDRVTRGTLLARVRPIDYEQLVAKAKAGLQAAEAQLAQAEASLGEANLSYERASNLFNSASIPKPQYDHAKAGKEAAQAGVAAAQAGVAAARTTLQQAELALEDTYLWSPIIGWILARTVEVGSLAGNAGPGFSLIDTSQVKAVFGVPDTALKVVQKGRAQKIMIEALSHPVKGVVTAVSPQADPRSRVFSVEVTIPNPHDEMRPGMIGNLTIPKKQEATTHPVVPLSAVVRSPDKPGGYALFSLERRGGKTYAVTKNIRIGAMYGNSLEVIEGAAPGDLIVVMGAATIRNGEEVRVIGQEQGTGHGAQER